MGKGNPMKNKLKAFGYLVCGLISTAVFCDIVYNELEINLINKPDTGVYYPYGYLVYVLMTLAILAPIAYTSYNMFKNSYKNYRKGED